MSAGEVLHPRKTHYSTTNCTNFHEWGAASPQILLAGFIRVHAGYFVVQGHLGRMGARRGFGKIMDGKIMDGKIIFLGIRLRASRLRRSIQASSSPAPFFSRASGV